MRSESWPTGVESRLARTRPAAGTPTRGMRHREDSLGGRIAVLRAGAGPPRCAPAGRCGATLVFWVWSALFLTLWSLATPLWSAPDSIAHDLRAYGAAHGNLTPAPPPGDQVLGTLGIDRVPRGLMVSARTAGCYVPAGGVRGLHDPDRAQREAGPLRQPGGTLHPHLLRRGRVAHASIAIPVGPGHAVRACCRRADQLVLPGTPSLRGRAHHAASGRGHGGRGHRLLADGAPASAGRDRTLPRMPGRGRCGSVQSGGAAGRKTALGRLAPPVVAGRGGGVRHSDDLPGLAGDLAGSAGGRVPGSRSSDGSWTAACWCGPHSRSFVVNCVWTFSSAGALAGTASVEKVSAWEAWSCPPPASMEGSTRSSAACSTARHLARTARLRHLLHHGGGVPWSA